MTKVCLVLIVKDEELVIERCLRACMPYIHSWCIVDTGSTDLTMEIIRETLKEIPGELHRSPWVGFSHNRTEAMQLARARGDADFILMIDADDTWTPTPSFSWPELESADAWEVHMTLGSLGHYRIQLTRASQAWRYEGAAHEHLVGPAGWKRGRLRGVSIVCGNDGHRRRTEPVEKYIRVAKQLEESLEENPRDTRALFYCAQSWRDAGELERALELYQVRATLPGEEEAWFSMLQIAELKRKLSRPAREIEDAYLAAFERRPTRAEPLFWLATYYRKQGRHALAFAFAAAAKELPRPTDTLFVYESVYDWQALDEYAVNCTHVGRYPEASALMRRLLLSARIPEADQQRIARNLDKCERPLARLPVLYGDRVTVAMSTYGHKNGDAFVAAVTSVLEQSYKNLLLVIVCDGDELTPWERLPAHILEDPRLVLHHNLTNQGQFFCHELVRRATPDRMLTVQDDDDVSAPDRIEKLVTQMVADKSDVVFSHIERVFPDGSSRISPCNPALLAEEPLEAFIHVGSHVALFRTEALCAVGGYYGGFRLGYDTMVGMTISRLGRPSFVSEPLYTYHHRHESMTNKVDTGHGSWKRRLAISAMVEIWKRAVRHGDPTRELRESLAQRITAEADKELTAMTESLSSAIPAPREATPLSDLLPEYNYSELPSSLSELRQRYVNEVSKRKDMAVSVATGALVTELIASKKTGDQPSILDVGSGYTTAVIRRAKAPFVTTVDHDPAWLSKTQDFVASQDECRGDCVHGWVTWDQFAQELRDAVYELSFDLIVNDLGGMERRAESLPILWDLLRPGGFMLLDDMHKPEYRQVVEDWMARTPDCTQYNIRAATMDSFGRFAYLVQRTEKT